MLLRFECIEPGLTTRNVFGDALLPSWNRRRNLDAEKAIETTKKWHMPASDNKTNSRTEIAWRSHASDRTLASVPAAVFYCSEMSRTFLWSRRVAVAVLCLMGGAWICAEASQWIFRRQAECLLTDVKSIYVGQQSAEAESVLRKWRSKGVINEGCNGDNNANCYFFISIRHTFPEFLRGSPENSARNIIPAALDFMGLRNSVAGAGVQAERGVVVSRQYWEEVDLPVRDWFLRGGAYVPSLAVSAVENDQFRSPYERAHINPSHPFRKARRFKGPYGLGVDFTTEESASERAKLMDFRFSCITQFFPCSNEQEILPEGALLLSGNE